MKLIKKFARPATWTLVLSLLLHFILGLGLRLSSSHPDRYKKAIEVTLVEPSKEKTSKTDLTKNMQIVEQDEHRANDQIPEEAKFLGKYDQKVVKETKARETGNHTNAAGAGGQNPKSIAEQMTQKSKTRSHTPEDDKSGNLPVLSRLKPQYNFDQSRLPQKEVPDVSAAPSSQRNDFLKDIQEGPQTLLNTREFVYYSYYSRIREKLRQQWEPRIKEKIRTVLNQGRAVASARDRITKVVIVLDSHGALVNVQIIGESGVSDLDDAAIEAFRAAEPFPNPPKGIIESDGRIRIRWDFILEA